MIQPDLEARSLPSTDTVTVWDVLCPGQSRSTCAEECATGTHLVFPYRGAYVHHVGRAKYVAEANQVVFMQRRRWMYDRVVDEPRLTHEYRDLAAAPAFLVDLANALSDYCGVRYDRIWMNWYRDNRDSTSWHVDRPANTTATATVPVLSLGATRRFLIRPYGGGRSIAFTLPGGDVLIMRGRCRRDWQQSAPKQQKPATSRMSLNFSSGQQLAHVC